MKKYLRQLNEIKNIYVQNIQEKELSDEELSMVVGGLNAQSLPLEQGSKGSTNLISSKQLNKAGYAIGG